MKLTADIKNVDRSIFIVMQRCPLNPASKQQLTQKYAEHEYVYVCSLE